MDSEEHRRLALGYACLAVEKMEHAYRALVAIDHPMKGRAAVQLMAARRLANIIRSAVAQANEPATDAESRLTGSLAPEGTSQEGG